VTRTGVWMYPWDLLDHGADAVAEDLVEANIDEVFLAASYHSVAATLGNNPRRTFFYAPSAALYFSPEQAYWSATTVKPVASPLLHEQGDALASARSTFREAGLRLTAWTVCLHASCVAAQSPETQLRSILGTVPNLFCLRRPETKRYTEALVRDVSERVDRVQLEAAHWLRAPHATHAKTGLPVPELASLLLSWCICDWCREATADLGGDPERLCHDLTSVVDAAVVGTATLGAGEELGKCLEFAHDRVRDLEAFLSARVAAVLDLAHAARVASRVPVEFLDAGDARLTGVDVHRLLEIVEEVRIAAYGAPAAVRETIEEVQSRGLDPSRLGLGLSLLGEHVNTAEEALCEATLAAEARICSIGFYNFGLIPANRMPWMKEAAQRAKQLSTSPCTAAI
jgi:hypothetical protein